MNICVHELARQVSVQCVERGQLLKRLFSCYVKFLELVNNDQSKKRKDLKREYALKLDRYVSVQDYQVQSFKDQIQELEQNNRMFKAEQEELYRQVKEQN